MKRCSMETDVSIGKLSDQFHQHLHGIILVEKNLFNTKRRRDKKKEIDMMDGSRVMMMIVIHLSILDKQHYQHSNLHK